MTPAEAAAAAELVYREALYLDTRRWDDWLALWDERAVFWVPAWKSETEPTAEPESEISLIYITSRAQLAERVQRARSGLSAAAAAPLRTAHALSNLIVEPDPGGGAVCVRSVAATHVFDPARTRQHSYFARCEHRLVGTDGALRIACKKIVVLNDYLPAAMDFYTV